MVDGKNYEEDWFELPLRFSEISAIEDGKDFLDAIPKFMSAKEKGRISDIGYEMPNIGSILVGKVYGLEFIPDDENPSDGKIVVLKREYNTDF
jgi:hypothetical protein